MRATHKVKFYGVRCYMNDCTGDVWGCNWFWELLITPAVWFHWFCQFCNPDYCEDGFPLVIVEEYKFKSEA